MDADTIVVGLTYPFVWDTRAPEHVERDIDQLRTLDPRIEVIQCLYEEPHALRTARSSPPFDPALRDQAPALTDGQREMFEKVHISLSVDLPYGIEELAPNLRYVMGCGAGVGQLVSCLHGTTVRLTSAAGVNAVGIAEFVIGRLLQDLKKFRYLDQLQRDHEYVFAGDALGYELAGRTVGLIGLGAINAAVALRLKAFGCTVLATRRSWTPGSTAPNVDEVWSPDSLKDMLSRCDIVIAAVPETHATVDMMDADMFAAMPTGSYFCNVGRGSFVVDHALIDALESGHLRAAAIDVTRAEPLPKDSPLWDTKNLYVSPHSATSPAEFFTRVHAMFRENISRFLSGDERLVNEVDLASY